MSQALKREPIAEEAGRSASAGFFPKVRADARRPVLRIDDLDTSNGPALRVWLTDADADACRRACGK